MPFTKNQIITLEIETLSNDGNGVAHKDGQAVFVPLTAPGDVAEVRIVKPMKTYAFGRVEKLLTAGPGRVRQDCPVAGPCGGCGLRHISYEAECAAKTQFVRDAFARLGKLDRCRTCWAHPTRTATATRSSCPWAPTRTGIL